mmetsp:Transcript_42234/g.63769  ORF Transcript_42234/g.63769 Transcript_42234/m.63769 type:complete len:94 (+) Transcript_42234:1111-1392(+)
MILVAVLYVLLRLACKSCYFVPANPASETTWREHEMVTTLSKNLQHSKFSWNIHFAFSVLEIDTPASFPCGTLIDVTSSITYIHNIKYSSSFS